MSQLASPPESPGNLVAELRQLLSEARRQTAATVNVALTLLYWRVGDPIRRSILGSERAGHGKRILATLSQELVGESIVYRPDSGPARVPPSNLGAWTNEAGTAETHPITTGNDLWGVGIHFASA